MVQNNEKTSYQIIKDIVMEAYFDFCRDRGVVSKWPHREILGCIDYEYENSFQDPIEKIMLGVVQLVIKGGWYPEEENKLRNVLLDQMQQCGGFSKIIGLMPKPEGDLFQNDLIILKLI